MDYSKKLKFALFVVHVNVILMDNRHVLTNVFIGCMIIDCAMPQCNSLLEYFVSSEARNAGLSSFVYNGQI